MKKVGFTLSEVLITLSIIGIVAALTLPTLIQKQQKQQTITAVQKAYSIMNQNLKMSIAENGIPENWIGKDESPNYATTINYFNKYIRPYYKIANICTGATAGEYNNSYYKACGYKSIYTKRSRGWENNDILGQNGNRAVFATADGIIYFFYPYSNTTCTEKDTSTPENPQYTCIAKSGGSFFITVDINGPKGPNTWGKDTFEFSLNAQKETIMPYCYEKSLEDINKNCSKEAYEGGRCCGAKLVNDGWKMKEDYPW